MERFFFIKWRFIDYVMMYVVHFSLCCFKLLDNGPDVSNTRKTDYRQFGISIENRVVYSF